MKNILIGPDEYYFVYSVPNVVAENLEDYFCKFFNWLKTSSDANKYKKYDKNGYVVYHYDAPDFIEYLNRYIFPNEKAIFIEEIGEIENNFILKLKYKNYPKYSF